MRGTPHERWLAKVRIPRNLSDCWEWTAARGPLGYGLLRVAGRAQYAHRLSYEFNVGPIPAGLVIDHLCRNPSCVNPAHLEPVTQAENLRRARRLKTHCPRGHALTVGNTYSRPSRANERACRTCRAEGRKKSE